MMMNSGFFYVSFIEECGVTREVASWPTSILSSVSHSSGLLVSCAQRHLSVFQIGLIGSVFLWAGILGAVFAPNMAWMTLTLGAIHGVGVGVVCVTLVIVVMMYFDKYRGIASGIKYTGYSLASLLFPMILTSLKDAYGFRGSMLVYAAITMNVTALTLLLKEPPWEINDRNRKTKTSKEERS
ncbi:monocarboxylate transporter 9-like [Dermacentor silvarum]|uniref:monocarboxylate transporter 9-like n=1 Tax=Dermacentor silvarum TaxID=543639 RepID=UPI0018990482|nr:monocarboxylate transporter 9-like [Dermacentor silvarum]